MPFSRLASNGAAPALKVLDPNARGFARKVSTSTSSRPRNRRRRGRVRSPLRDWGGFQERPPERSIRPQPGYLPADAHRICAEAVLAGRKKTCDFAAHSSCFNVWQRRFRATLPAIASVPQRDKRRSSDHEAEMHYVVFGAAGLHAGSQRGLG